jgi:probable HAF family extracellular repeat protein
MNLLVTVRFFRAFAKGAPKIVKSPCPILRLVCTLGAVAAVLFGGAVSNAFAAASLTPLGNLRGDPSSIGNGVSGDGSVVVGTSGGYGGQAFRWTASVGMVGLGRPPGDFYCYARAVNGDGSVVVGEVTTPPTTAPRSIASRPPAGPPPVACKASTICRAAGP